MSAWPKVTHRPEESAIAVTDQCFLVERMNPYPSVDSLCFPYSTAWLPNSITRC